MKERSLKLARPLAGKLNMSSPLLTATGSCRNRQASTISVSMEYGDSMLNLIHRNADLFTYRNRELLKVSRLNIDCSRSSELADGAFASLHACEHATTSFLNLVFTIPGYKVTVVHNVCLPGRDLRRSVWYFSISRALE